MDVVARQECIVAGAPLGDLLMHHVKVVNEVAPLLLQVLQPDRAGLDIAIVVLFLGKDEEIKFFVRQSAIFRVSLMPGDLDRMLCLGDICAQIVVVEPLTSKAELGELSNKNLDKRMFDECMEGPLTLMFSDFEV